MARHGKSICDQLPTMARKVFQGGLIGTVRWGNIVALKKIRVMLMKISFFLMACLTYDKKIRYKLTSKWHPLTMTKSPHSTVQTYAPINCSTRHTTRKRARSMEVWFPRCCCCWLRKRGPAPGQTNWQDGVWLRNSARQARNVHYKTIWSTSPHGSDWQWQNGKVQILRGHTGQKGANMGMVIVV